MCILAGKGGREGEREEEEVVVGVVVVVRILSQLTNNHVVEVHSLLEDRV